MRGRPIGTIPRLNLAPDLATSRDLLMRDRRGSLYVLDRRARRVRQVSDGPPRRRDCRVTDRRQPFGASTLADAPSSSALGWLPNGSAVIHFPRGPCGSSQGAPGVYAVPIRGMTTLLVLTPRFEHYWMWGG